MPTPQKQYSLSFSTTQASQIFPGVDASALVLALLAGVPPQPDWEGCLIFLADSRPGDARVGLRGPAALAIRDRLMESVTRLGLDLLLQEGDDELAMEAPIARIEDGAWC